MSKAKKVGRPVTHGMSGTRTYKTWTGMIQRCTNLRDTSFHRYGGSGIKVCDEWLHSFESFLFAMGPRPEGTSIDRIDSKGNYEPGNCRWATATIQQRNRGITKCNTSFFTGVYWQRAAGKWAAYIKWNKKRLFLGLFDSKLDACLARAHAEREIGGYPGDLDSRIEVLVSTKELPVEHLPVHEGPFTLVEVYTPDPDDQILESITSEELYEINKREEEVAA